MTYSFLRVIGPSVALAALLGCAGCSTGTNTGNGIGGLCPFQPCIDPVNVTRSDGRTFRGIVNPDVSIATDSYAQSLPNPPMAKLTFFGGEVDLSDGGCQETQPHIVYPVQIFITTVDSSIDASGALRVHSAARSDMYAAGPEDIYEPPNPGWAVDLTVTADGQLTATLSLASADSLDAGATTQALNISGRIESECGASMPVSGGRIFSFPCWQRKGCGD